MILQTLNLICVPAMWRLKPVFIFFCSCSLFFIQRITLVDSVSEILAQNNLLINTLDNKDLVKIYLYGSSNFVDNDNRVIILAAIKFIKDSKRFIMVDDYTCLGFRD